MVKSDEQEFVGFHGTDSDNVKSIQSQNFIISRNSIDYLGYGVYFFMSGISCPIVKSEDWAVSSAWNPRTQNYDYNHYSVLRAKICGVNVADLRTDDDLKSFDFMRSVVLRAHNNHFERWDEYNPHHDRILTNFIADEMGLDVLICNFYVKSQYQRINKIDSRIPNCTIMCVKSVENIDISSIVVIKEGLVREY